MLALQMQNCLYSRLASRSSLSPSSTYIVGSASVLRVLCRRPVSIPYALRTLNHSQHRHRSGSAVKNSLEDRWGSRVPREYNQRHRNADEFSSRRKFGGDEFVKEQPWQETALDLAITKFTSPLGIIQQLVGFGADKAQAMPLVKAFVKQVRFGKVQSLSPDKINKMAQEALEPGMTFEAMGTSAQEAVLPYLDKVLWTEFFDQSEDKFSSDVVFRLQELRKAADMRFPGEWNPRARMIKRKIVMHVGPTNSGKTYNALQRLQEADSGVYLSPLRLLAHEIFDRLNAAGVPCNLVTGEERRYGVYRNGLPDKHAARVTSRTVEMADFATKIRVAVLDEIQMLADPERGWAWTQALLGLQAEEIHLCGEPTVVPLVKRICATLNEEVEVHHYDRLSKLEVRDESLYGKLQDVRPGDCVVTFSRKNIFKIKHAIEADTGHRCAVAYGALPPETRALQAKLFNDPSSGFDVLVASDAVGMGLNLNIRRVIFEAVTKFDGRRVRNLSMTQIKQIGGRAGRFGTAYAVGETTTLMQGDIGTMKRAMALPMLEIQKGGLLPPSYILEDFSKHLPGIPFSQVLRSFDRLARVPSTFFLSNIDAMIKVAELFDQIKFPLQERLPFLAAPIPLRNDAVKKAALQIAQAVSRREKLPISALIQLPEKGSKDDLEIAAMGKDKSQRLLNELEDKHRTIMLYLWLGQRFGDVLEGGLECEAMALKTRCEELLAAALERIRTAQSKRLAKSKSKPKSMLQSKEIEAASVAILKALPPRHGREEGDKAETDM